LHRPGGGAPTAPLREVVADAVLGPDPPRDRSSDDDRRGGVVDRRRRHGGSRRAGGPVPHRPPPPGGSLLDPQRRHRRRLRRPPMAAAVPAWQDGAQARAGPQPAAHRPLTTMKIRRNGNRVDPSSSGGYASLREAA